MHRRPLLDLLETYLGRYPEDRVRVDHVRQFVRVHPDCFERSCREGHITASAWIVSADHRAALLTHHRKLDRWLQLGGHADGDPDPWRVALREVREESGLERFVPLGADTPPLPLDIDVHLIPARGDEPAHLHHDVRYLLVAAPEQAPRPSVESRELRWIDRARLYEVVGEESMLRMERKARAVLSGACPAV